MYGMGSDEDCGSYTPSLRRQRRGGKKSGPPPRREKMCRVCGTRRLHWGEVEHTWRLFTEDGRMHSCRAMEFFRQEEKHV